MRILVFSPKGVCLYKSGQIPRFRKTETTSIVTDRFTDLDRYAFPLRTQIALATKTAEWKNKCNGERCCLDLPQIYIQTDGAMVNFDKTTTWYGLPVSTQIKFRKWELCILPYLLRLISAQIRPIGTHVAHIGYNLGPCEPPHPTMSNNLLHMDGTGRAWRPMEVHKGPRRFMEDSGGPQRPTEMT